MDSGDQSRVYFKDSVGIDDLLSEGTTWEIKTDFDDPNPTFLDEMNCGSDNEDDEDIDIEKLLSPWTQPFDDLKKQMIPLNEHIHKRVLRQGKVDGDTVPNNARVHLRYSAYWEKETAPFDSSLLRGSNFFFCTGKNQVLEGFELSVRTMKVKEESQFIISYSLLFGELGCPPRIRPKADALFLVEVMAFDVVGDLNAEQSVPEEDRNKYSKIIDGLKEIHLKGQDFFKHGDYRNAVIAFEKADSCLSVCSLANEQEEEEAHKFLLKLKTNLAVCYNHLNQPGKTCIAMKDIRKITKRPSCKALFHEARALHMLGDYNRSLAIMKQAQNMEPGNKVINEEMKLLNKMATKYKENVKSMWIKAFGIIKTHTNIPNEDEVSNEFENEMDDLLKTFKEDLNLKDIELPPGFTAQELAFIDKIAGRQELKLRVTHGDEIRYTLTKLD